jgi:hypothetical protein
MTTISTTAYSYRAEAVVPRRACFVRQQSRPAAPPRRVVAREGAVNLDAVQLVGRAHLWMGGNMDGTRRPRDHHAVPVPRLHLRHERQYWKTLQNWLGDAARSATTRQRRTLIACVVVVGAGLVYLNTPNATGSGDLGHLATADAAIWVGVLGICIWISTGVRG